MPPHDSQKAGPRAETGRLEHDIPGEPSIPRTHRWRREDGPVAFEHVKARSGAWWYRHEVDGGHCPEHGDAGGAWCKRKPAEADSMLWDMPALLPVLRSGGDVAWAEGEKDAHTVTGHLGTVCTTHHGGAGKICPGQVRWFRGFGGNVMLFADDDAPGWRDCLKRFSMLVEAGLDPGQLHIRLPAAGCKDVTEHFEAGYGPRDLRAWNLRDLEAATGADGARRPARAAGPGDAEPAGGAEGEETAVKLAAFLVALSAASPEASERRSGDRTYYTCPLADELHARGDQRPSFNIRPGERGGLVLACVCPGGAATGEEHTEWVQDVLDSLGLDWAAVSPPDGGGGSKASEGRPVLDVTNAAVCTDWLRANLGRGPLAGMLLRGTEIVHTPCVGEEGYVPLTEETADSDGPAQVRPATAPYIAARVQYTYGCRRNYYRQGKLVMGNDGRPVTAPGRFPVAAAETAVHAADMVPGLRRLRGVTHTPVVRADGSVLAEPGYDAATGYLHLPEPGLIVPPLPGRLKTAHLKEAKALITEMLAGFPFVRDHYRANYIGAMLLTPLIRQLAPPPYKLAGIGAHQPGSGKTLLAQIAMIIHGGVFRASFPKSEEEIEKQIVSVLSVTTAPLAVFDNVAGVLDSAFLCGLLTSGRAGGRPLGKTGWWEGPNDRVWAVSGNNLAISGDLPRRTLEMFIDPGMPNPETRTSFAIPDLPAWVRGRRGEIIRALLILVLAWAADGRPLAAERGSDGYESWQRIAGGILANAGLGGEFAHPSTRPAEGGEEDEWDKFLSAVFSLYGERSWTARDLLTELARVPDSSDCLPGDLGERADRNSFASVANSLGRWLGNRKGRWTAESKLTVVAVGAGRWRIKLYKSTENQGLEGLTGLRSDPSAREYHEDDHENKPESVVLRQRAAEISPLSPSSPPICVICEEPAVRRMCGLNCCNAHSADVVRLEGRIH